MTPEESLTREGCEAGPVFFQKLSIFLGDEFHTIYQLDYRFKISDARKEFIGPLLSSFLETDHSATLNDKR